MIAKQRRKPGIALNSDIVFGIRIGLRTYFFTLAYRAVCIKIRKNLKSFARHRRIDLLVGFIRIARKSKVCPRRYGDNSRGHSSALIAELLAKRIAKTSTGTLAANNYLRRIISVRKQVSVCIKAILKRARRGLLGRKSVFYREYAYPAL